MFYDFFLYKNWNFSLIGGFSKGYVVDQIYNELTKYNTSFMVSAGSSSIMAYVYEDEGISWKVGSKDPNNKDSLLYAYPLMNEFTSSSGDYEQYYINEDNILRHHILNPYTGYSENYYRAVELKSNKNSGAIDALSTAIFSIGDIDQIIDTLEDISRNKYLGYRQERSDFIDDFESIGEDKNIITQKVIDLFNFVAENHKKSNSFHIRV